MGTLIKNGTVVSFVVQEGAWVAILAQRRS